MGITPGQVILNQNKEVVSFSEMAIVFLFLSTVLYPEDDAMNSVH
jgi:hypothetical protein